MLLDSYALEDVTEQTDIDRWTLMSATREALESARMVVDEMFM